MGIYLNPDNKNFQDALNSQIYVDKSELICYTNKVINSLQKFICVSRPRRFGKSLTAEMISSYYNRGIDSTYQFEHLKIAKEDSFKKHLNQYNVIFLNMQEFWSDTHDIHEMLKQLTKYLLMDLLDEYPDVRYRDETNLITALKDIYAKYRIAFVVIIDEWDCIFRENKEDTTAQNLYLDFLRNFLKDKSYVALAYMTGILPIKKYGTHSALNMFDEFSMTNPRELAEFVGFTESEVKQLCIQYDMDFEETKRWYDGYQFENAEHIYSPRSVVASMTSHCFDSYWNQTETFEALRDYIALNYDGLKDTIVELLAGERKEINSKKFTNDMTTFQSADDVLTLLIHLGYLGYNFSTKEVFIPNSEVASEFCNAIEDTDWHEVIKAVQNSKKLVEATWNQDTKAVAEGLEQAHFETSILKYNDENSLACVISLAYYSARTYYTQVRELPTGKGFADLVFLPRKNHLDKPAIVVELKWDKSAKGAIAQIKEKNYGKALEDYQGDLLLVGVNYDVKSKKHECEIEMY
jgi:hypothetical protein